MSDTSLPASGLKRAGDSPGAGDEEPNAKLLRQTTLEATEVATAAGCIRLVSGVDGGSSSLAVAAVSQSSVLDASDAKWLISRCTPGGTPVPLGVQRRFNVSCLAIMSVWSRSKLRVCCEQPME